MQHVYEHSFNWTYNLKASPTQLWPFISDTNKFLKKAGQFSVKKEPFSRDNTKGFLELTSAKISANAAWIEDPFTWEKPYKFGSQQFLKNLRLAQEKKQI